MNYEAGGKTAISNAIMAVVVLVTLLFLMPLFSYTPEVTLSAIIVVAVMGLIDIKGVINLWKLDKLDFFACACSLLGVLFLSVAYWLAIAVMLSFIHVLLLPYDNLFRFNWYKESNYLKSFSNIR